jgi:hypothetical protein
MQQCWIRSTARYVRRVHLSIRLLVHAVACGSVANLKACVLRPTLPMSTMYNCKEKRKIPCEIVRVRDTILLHGVQSVTRGRPPTLFLRPDHLQATDLVPDCIFITDAEQGLILGPAFTVPFLIGGLPISAAADHYRLTTVLAIGCALWSCVVVALSWSSSLAELVVWRFVFSISPTLAHRNLCTHVLFSTVTVGSASEIAMVIVACSSPLYWRAGAFVWCPCCERNKVGGGGELTV